MSLQRSKSAPHIVGSPVKTIHLPRSTSHQQLQNSASNTRGYTPRTEREDPFSLAGFFPAALVEEEEEWRWLHAEEGESSEGDQVRTPSSGIFGQAEDRNTREAIEGEDKLGVLALGQWGQSDEVDGPDIGLLSPYREVVDEESLYLAVSSQRETAASGPRAESRSLDSSPLFFPADGGSEIESVDL
ncbi:hypothetical protein K443DRAFT_673334 [Laccaria amethystina LaAM-08-1]|uniref:Uncharacterized protein n=1 Tax=Laccaria amethystina LaAM-08-1 TaxID=1095629 RepID=A0A0C9YAY9_9AGAR|nr:hypothetical protein K443DRAFT_673334 [Laccaria amethystina LaAM-08-1]